MQYQNRAMNEPQEDCRDYLRTGRCKYGASCKYRHPANVQSGGGMKAPVDPSEPLFPIRPNEPPCQYYLKHGTCKFGQACKFHHPPQHQLTALVGNNTVVMNVASGGGNSDGVAQHIILNSVGESAPNATGSQQVTLQFLPQRPSEPDCIYFLRNGRCKYGATCRYHHPVSVHQQRRQTDQGVTNHTRRPVSQTTQMQCIQAKPAPGEARRPGTGDYQANSVQFVSHQPVPTNYAQQPGQGSQILVSDGAIAFVPSSNSSPVITSSSVASSYETAASGFEYLPTGESWNRSNRSGSRESLNAYGPSGPKRSGSGGSLNAYTRTDSSGQLHTQMMNPGVGQVVMPASTSDNSINSRQRSVSYGSMGSLNGEGNGAQGYAAPLGEQSNDWQNTSNHPPSQLPQPGNRQWQHRNRVDGMPPTVGAVDAQQGHFQDGRLQNTSRPKGPTGGAKFQNRRRRQSEFDDDGLSMMTSALLNMMDTPEDSAVNYAFEEAQEHPPHSVSQDQGPVNYSNIPYDGGVHAEPPFELGYHQQSDNRPSSTQYQDLYTANQSTSQGESESGTRWSPTWNGTQAIGSPLEQNAQSISVIQQHQNAPASPHNPDVGLYLS